MKEYLNQYEACDKILALLVSNPTKWFSPKDIQKLFWSSIPLEKVQYLIDFMALTQRPDPAKFERNLEDQCWNIKMNGYTEEFLKEGGFTSNYNEMLEESMIEDQKKTLEIENLRLQNENLKYQQTIRVQEQRIRDLDEQNGFFQLLQKYWWFIGVTFSLGTFIGKFIWS